MKTNDKQLGRPDILYRATKNEIEAMASPEAGMLAYATDTGLVGVYNGSQWQWGQGGYDVGIDAPVNWPSDVVEEFDSSLSSNWITVNLYSNDSYRVEKSALILSTYGVTSIQLRLIVRPIPSTYFRCYAKVSLNAMTSGGTASDWTNVGLCLYDQNSGKVIAWMNMRSHASNTAQINQEFWNSPTSWNSNQIQVPRIFYFHPYLAIHRTSSGYSFEYSMDGIGWSKPYVNQPITFLTPTHIGMVASNMVVPGNAEHGLHWMRFQIL